ncbi:MAG: CopG family transcriptional regulator [bacterium]
MATQQKTTVYLDPEAYEHLKVIARREDRAPAQLVREAVAEYVARHAAPGKPRSIGSGRSGRGDLSARAETLLRGMGRKR